MGLITTAENLYAGQKKVRESQKTRLIKSGSGRPPKLAIAAQILMTNRIPTSPTHLSNHWRTSGNRRING